LRRLFGPDIDHSRLAFFVEMGEFHSPSVVFSTVQCHLKACEAMTLASGKSVLPRVPWCQKAGLEMAHFGW